MSDILERLRAVHKIRRDNGALCHEAADEIGRLRGRVAGLEAENIGMGAENTRLRAEVAALRADKARLDYLQSHPRLSEIRLGERTETCYFYGVAGALGLTLREVLDAALKERGRE